MNSRFGLSFSSPARPATVRAVSAPVLPRTQVTPTRMGLSLRTMNLSDLKNSKSCTACSG